LKFSETELKGAFILEVKKLEDERGFFGRTFCQKEFEKHGMNPHVVQANVSYNKFKGILRGMHYQLHPYEETKLVRCVRGAIYDVIIDLRKDSPTYTKWIGVELKEDSYQMLFVPEGFGHGFITLEDNTEVIYQVSQFYTPGAESGIRWNDPVFDIKWPIEPLIISQKDRQHSDYIV
jgi:dTDP-4-dehydrorhamnose 3,5-epimerase